MALLARLASALILLACWWLASRFVDPRTLPSPEAVAAFVGREAASGDLLRNIGITLWRVVASFVLAMATARCSASRSGARGPPTSSSTTPLLVLLNTPALIVTVLAYIWLGLTETAAILAVALNKMPNVAVILREGARGLDPGLEEMAQASGTTAGPGSATSSCPSSSPSRWRRRARGSRSPGRSCWWSSCSGAERRRLRHLVLLPALRRRGADRLQPRVQRRDAGGRRPAAPALDAHARRWR